MVARQLGQALGDSGCSAARKAKTEARGQSGQERKMGKLDSLSQF